ncbi:hypothetical protein B0H11DRAFT_2228162 [Mycena galericulata]|nr:hypothetical protein B0H11DRAFT_2228162 [Mycena galericulata]
MSPPARKRRKIHAANDPRRFVDLAAQESESSDDDDANHDDFIAPDEYLRVRGRGQGDSPRLFHRPPEDETDNDGEVEEIVQQYRDAGTEQGDPNEVRNLWKLAVVMGHEVDVVNTIREWIASGDAPEGISAAYQIRDVRGEVFVVASTSTMREIQRRVAFVKSGIPSRAQPEDIAVVKAVQGPGPRVNLAHSWVRYTKQGDYCGDLAWVQAMETDRSVALLLVPRLPVALLTDVRSLGDKKRKRLATLPRPPARLHLPIGEPDDFGRPVNVDEILNAKTTAEDDHEFWGGLLVQRGVKIRYVSEESVAATAEEVARFHSSPAYTDLIQAKTEYDSCLHRIRDHIDTLRSELTTRFGGPPPERGDLMDNVSLAADRFDELHSQQRHVEALYATRKSLLEERHTKATTRFKVQDLRKARAVALKGLAAAGVHGFREDDMREKENHLLDKADMRWVYMDDNEWRRMCDEEDAQALRVYNDHLQASNGYNDQANLELWQKLAGLRVSKENTREQLELQGWLPEMLPPVSRLRVVTCNKARELRDPHSRLVTLPPAPVETEHYTIKETWAPSVDRRQKSTCSLSPFQSKWVEFLQEGHTWKRTRANLWTALRMFDVPAHREDVVLRASARNLDNFFFMPAISGAVRVGDRGSAHLEDIDARTTEVYSTLVVPLEQVAQDLDVPEWVEVMYGPRCGDRGWLLNIDWESSVGDVFHDLAGLVSFRGDGIETRQGPRGSQNFSVSLRHIRRCNERILRDAPTSGANPELQTGEQRIALQRFEAGVVTRDLYTGFNVKLGSRKGANLVKKGQVGIVGSRFVPGKGFAGRVIGSRLVDKVGWMLDVRTEGRAVDGVVQVHVDDVVESSTEAPLAAFCKMKDETRAEWEHIAKVRALRNRYWLTQRMKYRQPLNELAPPRSPTPPGDIDVPEGDPSIWTSDGASPWETSWRDLPKLKPTLPLSRLARSMLQLKPMAAWPCEDAATPDTDVLKTTAKKTRCNKKPLSHWLLDPRLIGLRLDFFVKGTKEPGEEYRGGQYENKIGFLRLKTPIETKGKKAVVVDTVLGVHHRFITLQIQYMYPMVTTEREESSALPRPILGVTDNWVAVIGPDKEGCEDYIGRRGLVVTCSAEGNTGVVDLGQGVLKEFSVESTCTTNATSDDLTASEGFETEEEDVETDEELDTDVDETDDEEEDEEEEQDELQSDV